MTVQGPAPPVPTPEQLLEGLKTPLRTIIQTEIEVNSDPEKLYQYYNAQRNYLMLRGFQWVAPTISNGGYASLQPVTGPYGTSNDDESGPAYDYTQNIFRKTHNSFVAAIGQRSPNVMCMPDDPDDDANVSRADNAQQANRILDSWWNIDERCIEATSACWTTGPAYIYTPYVADEVLYGTHNEPIIEIVNDPVAGPVPQQTGMKPYPNGQVQCHVVDCTKVTVPFGSKRDLKFCPWLDFAEEQNKGSLLLAYPELRGMDIPDGPIGGGGSSSVTGRQTRDTIVSPYGGYRIQTGNWTHRRLWLQPWMYEVVKDDEDRAALKMFYPRGLRITLVQDIMVRLDEEKLDEVWSAIQPSVGAVLNSDPAGQDMVSPQIIKNHTLNIAAETFERGLPITFARPDVIDFERLKQQRATPVQYMPTLPAQNERLQDGIWESEAAKVSEQLIPWDQQVSQEAELVVGLPPSIWGGSDAPTARQAEINKNAALQGLGPNWMYIRKGWEQAKRNGILQMCAYMGATIRQGKLQADLTEVAQGGWHCEADEAIPSTWGQQQDRLLFMMEKPPAVLQAWGYGAPENIEASQRLLGMPDWYTPGIDDYKKCRAVIAQLLQGQPQQGPDGQLHPSIPIDQFEDNHQLFVDTIRNWSQRNWKMKDSNPAGYANVIAYGTDSAIAANPPAPPVPMPPPTLKLSADLSKLGPDTAQAILGDFKIDAPPPMPPEMMQPQAQAPAEQQMQGASGPPPNQMVQ